MRKSIGPLLLLTFLSTAPQTFGQRIIQLEGSNPIDAPDQIEPAGGKKAKTAWVLSVTGTLVPIMLVANEDYSGLGPFMVAVPIVSVAGFFGGPSMGHFYAGHKGRAWGGIGLRLLGTFLVGAGIGDLFDSSDDIPAVGLVGLGVFAGSMVWNFATINSSVDQANAKRRERFSIAPVITQRGGQLTIQIGI